MTNEWTAIVVGNADQHSQAADVLDILNERLPLGPCQLQSSPLCTNVAVMERLDPMAMAPEDPAPNRVIPTCQECFDQRSDMFLKANAR